MLEIYVVWHPHDVAGELLAQQVLDHFHGTAFSGLIGGSVEVYVRSEGWTSAADAPRPIPVVEPLPFDMPPAELTAVVPVIGLELTKAVQEVGSPWRRYIDDLADAAWASPDTVGVFPLFTSTAGGHLAELFGPYQGIGVPANHFDQDEASLRCRDLAQGITEMARGTQDDIKVFVSHTKHASDEDRDDLTRLIAEVRRVIGQTRLDDFFDAQDLKPGSDWAATLHAEAATSALLAVRTDLYASREWCQREMSIAKRAGMPVVILDGLAAGERRGSFLMDHVPRVPSRATDGPKATGAIIDCLNQLVDECLKRALWGHQQRLGTGKAALDVAWWAPHAPEPVTLAAWLRNTESTRPAEGPLLILHPDPPLGPEERRALIEIASLADLGNRLDIVTPRGLATRGA